MKDHERSMAANSLDAISAVSERVRFERTPNVRYVFTIFLAALLTSFAGLGSIVPQGAYASSPDTSPIVPWMADAAPPHDPTVGAAAGSSGVSGGAAVYSIPVSVPPGRAGMQPSVSLNYSSRGGNGIAGMGWSLSASSAIHRCSKTVDQDGASQGIRLGADDRICLDGQRLVRVGGGAYGAASAEYRTEIDSYARILQYGGNLAGAAACFRVEERGGRVKHYGAVIAGSSCQASTRNARVQPGGVAVTMSWLIEKEEDRVGNNQFFSYGNYGNGEALLSRIDYTGFGANAGDRSVRFVYEARPAPTGSNYANDISSSYLAGGLTLQTQRLQRIETYAGASDKVAAYKFGYIDHDFPSASTSRQTGRSLLQTFTQCAYVGAQETCLLKSGQAFSTQFDWWDEDPMAHATRPRFSFKALTIPGLPQSAWTAEDALIAQDELEALQQEQIDELNALRGGSHTAADVPVQDLEGTPLGSVIAFSTIADFDGDGARESLARVQSASGPRTYVVQMMGDRSVRSAIDVTGNLFVFASGNSYDVVDIDGDGRSEILSHTNPISFLAWNLAAGQAPAGNPFRTVTTSIPTTANTTDFRARMADFDGDGRPDLVTFEPHAACGNDGLGPKRGVFVHRNTIPDGAPVGATASFSQASVPAICLARTSGTGEYVERIADFDGDGLPDLFVNEKTGVVDGTLTFARILRAQISLSFTSTTAAQMGLTAVEQERRARTVAHWIDVNGDGLDDFVFARVGTSWLVRLNQGGVLGPQINTGSGAGLDAASESYRYANRLPTMDFDGDGRIDLLAPSGFASKVCAISTRTPNVPGECPGNVTPIGQCVVYLCPEDPGGGLNMPSAPNIGHYWGSDEVRRMYGQGAGGLDSSSYRLNALRFVQTGPSAISVQVTATELVASLGREAPEDTYGDGVSDLVSSVGCKYRESGAGLGAFAPCLIINDGTYGPSALPNGQVLTAYYQNHNDAFISEGRGTSVGDTGIPRPADLLSNVVNSLEDWTAWRYLPLSVPTPANLPAEVPAPYTVPANPAERYVDARHFYFTSSMPVVQVMTRSSAAVLKDDPTIAVGARSWYYGYQEAMYNRMGRGFQGFRKIVESNVLSSSEGRGNWITTVFHQKFPLTSRVESVEVAPVTRKDRPILRETNSWRCALTNRSACPTAPTGNTIHTPFLDTQVVQNYDLASAQLGSSALVSTKSTTNAASTAATASGWDAYGNLRNQIVTLADGGTGGIFVASHTSSTTNNYTIDASNWWVDKLDSSTTTVANTYSSGHAVPAGATNPSRSVATSHAWNADRTAQSQTVQPGIPNQQVQTSFGYPTPSYGLPTGVTQTASAATPASRYSTITYSKDGTTVAADGYFALQSTNAANHVTTTETRTRDGQVSRMIAPTGLRAVTQYDAFGRPIQVESKNASDALLEPIAYIRQTRCSPSTGSCAGGYGEGDGQVFAALRTTTVKDGAPTQVVWSDKLGRPVKRAVRGFNGAFVQSLIEYDRMGSMLRESTPHFADGTAYWTNYEQYDQLGRVRQKTSPGSEMDATNGNVRTLYTYSGIQTKIRVQGSTFSTTAACPANRPCMEMYRWHDALGRLMKTQDALGGFTKYWYDGSGNPVVAEDAESNHTMATYNEIGHRLTRSDPDAGSAGFAYDGFGQVLTQTDARNITTTNTYDVLGRLVQRSSTNPAGAGLGAESVLDTWGYDPPGAAGGQGLLEWQKRQRGAGLPVVWQENYAYEPATKRLSTQTTSMEGEASPWVTGYTYDAVYGRESTVSYPSGLVIRKGYTADGYANSLINNATNGVYWTATAQDAWGAVTAESYGNGVTGSHANFASTGQVQQKRWSSSGATIDQFQYLYDSFGNLKQQQRNHSIGGSVQVQETYGYDRLQRLTQTTRVGVPGAPAPVNLGYSASGNLTHKSDNGLGVVGAYTYGGNGCGPHAVTSVARAAPAPARTYGCDANGNVVSGNELNAVYDFMNLPRRVNRIGAPHTGSTDFRYAATGERYQEVTGTGETTRTGARGYEKVSGTGVNPSPRHRHELGPVIVARANGVDEVIYATRDRMGSLVALLPANPYKGALSSYDAFGKPRDGDFTDNGKSVEAGRLQLRPWTARGFTGHEHIDEGRVIHMNGRIYDYALGRFLGVDPIIQFPSNSQSLNPYSYILNNPLSGTDPSGYFTCNEDGECTGTVGEIERIDVYQDGTVVAVNSDNEAINLGKAGDGNVSKTVGAFLINASGSLGHLANGAQAGASGKLHDTARDTDKIQASTERSSVWLSGLAGRGSAPRGDAEGGGVSAFAGAVSFGVAPWLAELLGIVDSDQAQANAAAFDAEYGRVARTADVLQMVRNPAKVIAKGVDDVIKGPIHHICTNKNCVSAVTGGPWTPRFQAMFDRAGMKLEDALNKIAVPGHRGPHPEIYHQAVFRRLESATSGLNGSAYRDALQTELRAIGREIQTPGSILNGLMTTP